MPAEWLFRLDVVLAFTPPRIARWHSGARLDANEGVIDVHVDEDQAHFRWVPFGDAPGVAGAKLEIAPKPPLFTHYLFSTGEPKDPPDATSPSGQSYTYNVPPGEYELRVTHPTRKCFPAEKDGVRYGWPGKEPDTMRVPVYPGYGTVVAFFCPAQK